MLCFEILVNGKKLCTASIGEFGCLTSILSRVQVRPEERLSPEKEWRTGKPKLRIGGLAEGEHLEWLNKNLKVGDEVTIRIIEAIAADEPKKKYHTDPEEERKARRKYYEECKREFEN